MITPRIARFALSAALLLSLAGCEDPTKDKPRATVSSAAPAQAPSGLSVSSIRASRTT